MLSIALLAAAAAASGAWLARSTTTPAPQLQAGTRLPVPRALREFTLQDATGAVFGSTELAMQPSVLFFGFTQCPDVCPTTLAMLAQLRRAAQLPQLRVIMISVDPQHDTPAVLQAYLRAFDAQMIGLTGSVAAINSVTQDVGVAVAQVALPGGGYAVDHSATLFLTDAQGRLVAVFTPPFKLELILADLRALWPTLKQ